MAYLPQYPDAPPSADFVLNLYQHYQTLMSSRNAEYQLLRKVYDGDFVGIQQAKALGDAQLQERVKLIYNICNATVRRYMDQLSAPPRIECVPRGWEDSDLEMADKRTKFLEYVYEENGFEVKLMQAGFYQSLLDNAVWHVRPNPNGKCKIKLELGVPDFYYPIVASDDWNDTRAVIYAFRKYKDHSFQQSAMRAPQDGSLGLATDVVVEWWDRVFYMRFENGRLVARARHDLGVIPWHKADNIPIPHRFRGQGDIDQAIGLNEYLNMLMSDMADMINYAANPIAVVRGTKAGGTNLPFAPRAVWELERDAQVGFLQWSGAPPSVEAQLIRSIQAIEDSTGVSSPAFGREIPSGTSGSAVRSLMAGFNTRLGTKQTLMGGALVRANETICRMAEVMFPDWEIPVVGEISSGKFKGRQKEYTVRPREFSGWYKNRLIFPPSDPTANYFQEMDKLAKGIQSRETTMRNLGIKNVHDEQSRIAMERMEEAEHANNMGLAQQGQFIGPAQREQESAEMDRILQSLQGMGAVPGAAPDAQEDRERKQAIETSALSQRGSGLLEGPQSPASIAPLAGSPGGDESVNIGDVTQALRRAANISGRAAIVGDFVKTGSGNEFTIALSNPQDAEAIKLALGPLASKAKFTQNDFEKPLPADSVEFTDPAKAGQKKNKVGAEVRKLNAVLQVAVLEVEPTNNNADVFLVGVVDNGGNLVPIAKTQPQRRIRVEQGELISIKIEGISRRPDGESVKWSLVMPSVIPSKSVPARPSSMKDIERLFEKANG